MSRRQKIKQALRVIVAVVVAVGLVFAARTSIKQWNAQTRIAEREVAEWDARIQRHSGSTITSKHSMAELLDQRDAAARQVPHLRNLNPWLIGAAGLFYAAGLLPGGWVLAESSRLLGQPIKLLPAMRAQVIGHVGKYVPGKAMVVAMRAEQLTTHGVSMATAVIAVFIETLLMMAVGASLAGTLVFWLPVPSWVAWTSLLGGLAVCVPTVPPLMQRILRRFQIGVADGKPVDSMVSWRFFLLGWCGQILAWLLIGSALTCLMFCLPMPMLTSSIAVAWMAGVAAIALAMVAGFASLLPGGAGVRELALTMVLSPVVGVSGALLAAILARLLFIVVEVLMAGVSLMVGNSHRDRGRIAAEPAGRSGVANDTIG
ncbi:MAG: lysylphosphatidylglycerol synthase transmembrane domain-containing protein [Planctomycetota bacterium]